MSQVQDPKQVYEQALESRRKIVAGLKTTEDRISNGRLLCFVVGVFSGAMSLWGDWSPWIPASAFAAFGAAILWHLKLQERLAQAERSGAYFQSALERLSHQWMGKGDAGLQWQPGHSLFAHDLDIFGSGSLFERLCSCRTQFGRESLARWLTETPDIATIEGRQGAVRTLIPRWEFREQLHLLGEEVATNVDPQILRDWSATVPEGVERLKPSLSLGLTAAMIVACVGWALGWWAAAPFLVVLALQLLYRRYLGETPARITGAVQEANRELGIVGTVLATFETTGLGDPWLEKLREGLNRDRASRAISELDRWVSWLDARLNQLFAPFAIILLWEVNLAYCIERWRRVHGESVREWLYVLGELEAVAALSGFGFDNPDHVFPRIATGDSLFDGADVGHPLLPSEKCVRNDVTLNRECAAWLISGSNMSGKSTLLRAVGVNAILAMAGAPVRARSLTVSAFHIGASLKSRDSLLEGTSRFYAEIRHLGEFVHQVKRGPFLFLIDEIFNGTNSHDRTQGACALVKEFVREGAVGMLTTHDLALTEIGASLEKVKNVHLEDRLVNGKLEFDYKVRPGVVERSNALELMRLVGLPV